MGNKSQDHQGREKDSHLKPNKNNQDQANNKIFEFFNSFVEEERTPLAPKKEIENIEEIPEFYEYIPIFTTSKKINPKYYLTGDNSCRVYGQINGEKSIDNIANNLKLNQNKVYNVCKNLIKMGFISFN